MKVLSIGNSFSEDAQRWLNPLSKCGDVKIDTVNLFIGGCSLQRHFENLISEAREYDFEINETEKVKRVSLIEGLKSDTYDVVTIQQVSGLSGCPQSFVPFLPEIIKAVKIYQPNAKLYYHKTWSYECDYESKRYKDYNSDQKEMYRRLCDCAVLAHRLCDLEIIPVGDFIQYLRENTKEFDYKNGGLSLNRDGCHLSWDYGRFAASAVWYKVLTGSFADTKKFLKEHPEFDEKLLNLVSDKLVEFFEEFKLNYEFER